MRVIFAVSLACVLSTAATAQESSARSWAGSYAGFGLSHDDFQAQDLIHGKEFSRPFAAPGSSFGGFAGYNLQKGAVVFGPELKVTMGSAQGSDGEYHIPFSVKGDIELRGRIGLDAGRLLPYAAIGYVVSAVRSMHEGSVAANDEAHGNVSGIARTFGVEYQLGQRSFVRLEYRHVNYSDFALSYPHLPDHPPHQHPMMLGADNLFVGVGVSF